MDVARAWVFSIAWAIPFFLVIEGCFPRERRPVRWRQIALAAGLFFVNTIVVRNLTIVQTGTAPLRVFAAWILVELFAYTLHRAMHRVPLLWRFHKVHHAPVPLAWHQSWWIHPLDVAMFALTTSLACGIAGAPLVAAAPVLLARKLLGLLQHANIAWPASPIDHVIVTPAVHYRHHREDLPPANFAGTFAILDRVFGTWSR